MADWNAVADRSADAWLFHRWEWIDIETRFFADRDLSFAIEDQGTLVAIHPLYLAAPPNSLGDETILHSGVHRLTGLAVLDDVRDARLSAARGAAMRHNHALAEAYDVDRVQSGAQTAAPSRRLGRTTAVPFQVTDFGYQLGMSFGRSGAAPCPGLSTLSSDQQVALSVADDVLFARLDEGCRRAVRKAQKSGLSWSIDKAEDRIERYFALASRSATRTGEPLPSIEYYRTIAKNFDASGRCWIAISQQGAADAAALLLLSDKGVVSFLAGVSEPDLLETRCNDHVHWETISWAKSQGHEVYRFGPTFPEVPRDWPFAKASAFKGKFGSVSVPMQYTSLYRRPERYLANLPARAAELAEIARQPQSKSAAPQASLDAQVIMHMLSIFGVEAGEESGALVLDRPKLAEAGRARVAAAAGRPVVALSPTAEFAATFDVTVSDAAGAGPSILTATGFSPTGFSPTGAAAKPWQRLRTLHASKAFSGSSSAGVQPVVTSADGSASWCWLPHERCGVLFVGTKLAADLVRYRQGDPKQAASKPTDAQWGIAGERPMYLFDAQLQGERPSERHADWWCEALAAALARHGGLKRRPMLPGNAPGAIVITGDDDQALLENYQRQRAALGKLPITYFLHPLTKHTRATLNAMKAKDDVELGLHPDALDAPERYDILFDEQSAWFEALTGGKAAGVRNHGFLNDGYWGHAKSWRHHGVTASSNLPGLDGRMLNGSLLPARLALDGELTDHWSVLTAIGDGVVFIHGWDDDQSAACVHKVADDIRTSGVPGVIVLNLHPDNIAKTGGLHKAALELAASGFVAWNLSECVQWFSAEAGKQLPGLEAIAKPPNTSARIGTLVGTILAKARRMASPWFGK